MEDQQFIMSTSMHQYLEEMDKLLKKENAIKAPEDLMDLTSEDRISNLDNDNLFNIDQMPDQSMEFDFGQPSHFNGSLFNLNPVLDDEFKEDEGFRQSNENNIDINKIKDASITKENLPKHNKKLNKDKNDSTADNKFKEPKAKSKVRVSDKERARKSRQRKKKYYEDLEEKVSYLEEY